MRKANSEQAVVSKPAKTAKKKAAATLPVESKKLMLESLHEITKCFENLSQTVDSHVMKTASIANHIVAIEGILAEVVAMTGLNLANVNTRIRAKVAAASDDAGAADMAIDLAASIASPVKRN